MTGISETFGKLVNRVALHDDVTIPVSVKLAELVGCAMPLAG